jgi:hypothetical protein
MINLADDAHMRGLATLAEEFYENILRPDEEPGFVSDDASLLDISLAPEEVLISKIETHYSRTVTASDLRKSFWVLLTDLNNGRTRNDLQFRSKAKTGLLPDCPPTRHNRILPSVSRKLAGEISSI